MAIAGPPERVGVADASTPARSAAHVHTELKTGLADAHATTPLRAVARGALALLSTQPLTWAATLVLIVLLPRYLSDVEFGQAALGANLAALVGPVCTLGLLDYLTRSLSSRPKSALDEAALAWVMMAAAGGIAGLLLAAFVAVSGLDLGTPAVLVAAVGTVLVSPMQNLLLTVLRAQHRMAVFAAISSVGMAAGALVPVAVVVAGGGLAGFALSQMMVSIVALAAGWWRSGIRLPRVRIEPRPMLALLFAGLPFLGSILAMQFYGQIQGIMLAMLAPVETLGWYSAATRIVGIPMFAPVLIVTPLLPALTRCKADQGVFRHTLNTSLRATLLVTLPFCVIIATAAPGIPHFLGWPEEFSAASPPMTILAPQLTLVALDMLLGVALIALGLERKWLIVGLVACVVSPTLNFILMPFAQDSWGNGGIGAAMASIATESVMLVGALVIMPRGILDRSILWLVARVLIAATPFVVISRQLMAADVWLPLALIPGGLMFVVGALALKVVRMSEVRNVRRLAVRTM